MRRASPEKAAEVSRRLFQRALWGVWAPSAEMRSMSRSASASWLKIALASTESGSRARIEKTSPRDFAGERGAATRRRVDEFRSREKSLGEVFSILARDPDS